MKTNKLENYVDQDYEQEYDQEAFEVYEESDVSALAEIKVSKDGGDTWERCKISMMEGLDQSGLNPGEIFVFNGEKYRVTEGDNGLGVEKLRIPNSKKKTAGR